MGKKMGEFLERKGILIIKEKIDILGVLDLIILTLVMI